MPVDREAPGLDRAERTVTHGKADSVPSLGQSISAALQRLRVEMGGKALAEHFDGRDGEEVAVSTVSRWSSEPKRFPAIFLPVLVEMDSVFRAQVFALLTARLAVPQELIRRLSPAAAEEVGRVTESLIIEEISPGRWVKVSR